MKELKEMNIEELNTLMHEIYREINRRIYGQDYV